PSSRSLSCCTSLYTLGSATAWTCLLLPLGEVVEDKHAAGLEADVPPPHGREPEGAALVGVFLAADAKEAEVVTDPDIGPGRRHRECSDSLERLVISDPPTGSLVDVLEATAAADPPDAGRRAVGSSEPRHAACIPTVAHLTPTTAATAPLRP